MDLMMKNGGWGRRRLFTLLAFLTIIGMIFATTGIFPAAAQPAPIAGDEDGGLPLGGVAIGAVILLLVVMWMPRKQSASGEGSEVEAAWWTTRKGREFIITLLLLFLIISGLVYVGMKALVAGGFLFTIWMVYRYFFDSDAGEKRVTTQKLADEIAEEMDYRGVKLDSRHNVYGAFLPGLGLHVVQFSYPTTLVFIVDVRTGERGGPLCCTLNEAVENIWGKKELWLPPPAGGKKDGLKPTQMAQITPEESG